MKKSGCFATLLLICLLSTSCAEQMTQFAQPAVYHEVNGELWLMDRNGLILSDLGFDAAYPFNNGYSFVAKDGHYGVVDLSGKLILPCDFDDIAIEDDIFITAQNGRYYLRDINGILLNGQGFDLIYGNGFGYVVEQDEIYGMLDRRGEYLLDIEWIWIGAYCDGWMTVAIRSTMIHICWQIISLRDWLPALTRKPDCWGLYHWKAGG